MSSTVHGIIIVLVCSAVTIILRAFPYIVFPEGREIPKTVKYLSDVFPGAVIGMLIIYCLKDVSITSAPFGMPELIAIAITALLHILRKNTLLSVLSGTVIYMILIQFVF